MLDLYRLVLLHGPSFMLNFFFGGGNSYLVIIPNPFELKSLYGLEKKRPRIVVSPRSFPFYVKMIYSTTNFSVCFCSPISKTIE